MLARRLVLSVGVLGVLGQGMPVIAEDAVKATPSQIVVSGDRCPQWACGFLSPRAQVEERSNDRSARVNGVDVPKDIDKAIRSQGIGYSVKADMRKLVLQSPKPDDSEQKKGSKAQKAVTSLGQRIRITTLDLERKGDQAVFSADQIVVGGSAGLELVPGQALSIPLTFRIGETSSSGEYSGNLLVQHDKGDLLVPITVKVRDTWWMALSILGVGVSLATMLSAYQANGFDRDEVRLKIYRLRQKMQSDLKNTTLTHVAERFQDRVNFYLEEVDVQLDEKKWEEARKSFKEGQVVWSRWTKEQKAWLEVWKYIEEDLKSRVGEGTSNISGNTSYGEELNDRFEKAFSTIATYETPEKFGQSLIDIKKSVDNYSRCNHKFNEIEELEQELSNNERAGPDCINTLNKLKESLKNFTLNDLNGCKAWMGQADKLYESLIALRSSALPSGGIYKRSGNSPPESPVLLLRSIPGAENLEVDSTTIDVIECLVQEEKKKAYFFPFHIRLPWQGEQIRVFLFRKGTHLVAIILICGTGLGQIYGSNPVFGANPAVDYFGLLAWGFSIEMTREKIAQRFKLSNGGEK
jgi:hypothetical protein